MKKKIIKGLVLLVCIILSASWHFRPMVPHLIEQMPNKTTRWILVKLLDDYDEEVVRNAAGSLGRIGDSTAYQPLIKAINHPVAMVRHNAINAMIELDQADLAVDATLTNIRNKEESPFVLDSALELLERLQDPVNKAQAVNALREFASRSEPVHARRKEKAEKIIRRFEKEREPDKKQ